MTRTRRQRAPAARTPLPSAAQPLLPLALLPAAGLATVFGLLYLATAARDIVVGDTPEFTAAAATLGVPHPPGYPLLTLIGHAFTWLPVGSIPFRVNLVSVLCGAATVGLTYATAWLLTGSRRAAAAGAVVLGTAPLFWTWSLVFETFPLNNLLAAAVMVLLVVWRRAPHRGRWLVAAAACTGLGMANQQTIALLAPAVIYVLWLERAVLARRPALVAACVLALLAGLLPYAYLPWAAAREPMFNWGAVASAEDFVRLVLRADYGTGHLIAGGTEHAGGQPGDRVLVLLAAFTPLQGTLLAAGAWAAWQQQRWWFWWSLLAFLATGPAFAAYANLALTIEAARWVFERFALLPMTVTAPLAAFGVLQLGRWTARAIPGLAVRRAATLTAALAIALAAFGAALSYQRIDQRHNDTARRFAEDILATVAPGGVLVATGDHIVLPVAYLQAVEGARPDVALVMAPLLRGEWYVRHLRSLHPGLTIPFPRHDATQPGATLRALVEANPNRTFAVMGGVPDRSLDDGYWYYRRGLISQVERRGTEVTLEIANQHNRELFERYRVPLPAAIKPRTFETGVLAAYAGAAEAMGRLNEQLGQTGLALEWFERALDIDPQAAGARDALARLQGTEAR